jgi:hypothetical protein
MEAIESGSIFEVYGSTDEAVNAFQVFLQNVTGSGILWGILL